MEYFYDEAKIFVQGGRGGDGCVSFRRERGVPRGGPNGGDGGDGGSVVLRTDKQISTLIAFHKQAHFFAQKGAHGQGKNKTGKRGKELIIKVPCGTVVRSENRDLVIGELFREDSLLVVAKEGKGGRGNARFKSAVHQSPRFSEKGEEGESQWITLELKLLADVGIIGVPNAGKSTLLRRISSAHPRVASYPFTTLRPYLGIVRVDEETSFVAADLPGLIKGASLGRGLGYRFLRHTERSKVLLHLIDMSPGSISPIERFRMVNEELSLYSSSLLDKPQLIVGNKMDIFGARGNFIKFRESLSQDYPIMAISALKGEGLEEMIFALIKILKEKKEEENRERKNS